MALQKPDGDGHHHRSRSRSRSASSSSSDKPHRPAPVPSNDQIEKRADKERQKDPLSKLLKEINKLKSKPDIDQAVLRNARKDLLGRLRDDIPDEDKDLKKAFVEARKTNDYEVIDAILEQFVMTPIQSGELLDEVIDEFMKFSSLTRVQSYFANKPYGVMLEKILRYALEQGELAISLKQREALAKLACDRDDMKLVAQVLATEAKASQGQDNELEKHSDAIFDLVGAKLKEYYANIGKDKKYLFRLVAFKDIIEKSPGFDFFHLDVRKVLDLANISLFHNNLQFVEFWIRHKPDILDDKTFKDIAVAKYKQALKELLLDANARNSYAVEIIITLLKSDVLKDVDLKDLFPAQNKLNDILVDTDPDVRELMTPLLKKRQILVEDFTPANIPDLIKACREADVDKVNNAIADKTVDVHKVRHGGRSLLFHAVSYDYGRLAGKPEGWPHIMLRETQVKQAEDEDFQLFCARKNKILKALLKTGKFTQADIDEAYEKVCRDGTVVDKSLPSKYAMRGDRKMIDQLIDAGANTAIGKNYIGIWRASLLAYGSARVADTILGAGAALIQHYTKLNTVSAYAKISEFVSAGTSVAAFEATNAVVTAYHSTVNLDFRRDNMIDFDRRTVVGSKDKTWYGGFVYGRNLEQKMRNKVGVINVENAVFEVKDINSRNRYIHHMIGMLVYKAFCGEQEEAKFKKQNSIFVKIIAGIGNFIAKKAGTSEADYLIYLEDCNKKCQYGIPGDNGYSFNVSFQKELARLFDEANILKTIDSIVEFPSNRSFFLDMAKGIDLGLIKTPLPLKKKIMDAYTVVLERVRELRTSQEVKKKESSTSTAELNSKRAKSRNEFGRLINIYDNHTKDSIPITVILMAQQYKEEEVMRGDRELPLVEKVWDGCIVGLDRFVGYVAPKFGIDKQKAHGIIGKSLQHTGAVCVGAFNFYEPQLRKEIAKEGLLKTFTYLSLSVVNLKYCGIAPYIIIPPLVFVLTLMYCREYDLNPIDSFWESYYAFNDSFVPRSDKSEVFIKASTRAEFDKLYNDIDISTIPTHVSYAM